ncbi:hypothetical protein DPMN_166347 [Dreissena polymorpha]|uniref:Uncharacterized protein n=1 Tax=Dreissena polymorpha TaxID=45954 RepID=A0A9D4EYG6_DREPO|nr:hypothetical protein DPMN_166347 [Dreissena polymorpha]
MSVARSGRQSNVSMVCKLTDDMALPSQNVILGVTEKKQQLISLICKAVCTNKKIQHLCTQTHKLVVTGDEDTPTEIYKGVKINRADLTIIHEEADVIMHKQMVDAVEVEDTGISVIADETDVFVLL